MRPDPYTFWFRSRIPHYLAFLDDLVPLWDGRVLRLFAAGYSQNKGHLVAELQSEGVVKAFRAAYPSSAGLVVHFDDGKTRVLRKSPYVNPTGEYVALVAQHLERAREQFEAMPIFNPNSS